MNNSGDFYTILLFFKELANFFRGQEEIFLKRNCDDPYRINRGPFYSISPGGKRLIEDAVTLFFYEIALALQEGRRVELRVVWYFFLEIVEKEPVATQRQAHRYW